MQELQGEQGSLGGGGLGDRSPDKAKVPGGRVLGDGGPMCVTSRRQGEGAPGRGSLGSWGSRGVSLSHFLCCFSASCFCFWVCSVSLLARLCTCSPRSVRCAAEQGHPGPRGQRGGFSGRIAPATCPADAGWPDATPTAPLGEGGDVAAGRPSPRSWEGEERPGAPAAWPPWPFPRHPCKLNSTLDFLSQPDTGRVTADAGAGRAASPLGPLLPSLWSSGLSNPCNTGGKPH